MACDYSDWLNAARRWAQDAQAGGWLTEREVLELREIDERSPQNLFDGDQARPLLVAFMGGTGVGKSSLLNRLAGRAIARTGVQRPTSHEVTLYRHHHVFLKTLPPGAPVTGTRIAAHDDDRQKSIIWIDMPDMDSVDQDNRNLVLTWLPHIDVLIYVVSPERYRDNREWRLLLTEGGRHAWIFVFNQWDKGCLEQYQDFREQLLKTGFTDPVIFKTACADPYDSTDEFDRLAAALASLATEHTVNQLERRGLQLKIRELQGRLQHCADALGATHDFSQTLPLWRPLWQKTVDNLQQGLIWPLKQFAAYQAEHAADLLAPARIKAADLWDAWAQTRFADAVDEFEAGVGQMGLPAAPLKTPLAETAGRAPKILQAHLEPALRQSLANPGTLLQRSFLKLARFCEIFLPLISICWVGYQVFTGYYASSQTNSHYLGVDFAVHSALLIALSWLMPFFILKKLKPSLEKSALQGLQKGLALAFDEINETVTAIIADTGRLHQARKNQLQTLLKHAEAVGSPSPRPPEDEPLARMLLTERPQSLV